jgi:hypothetical protein
MPAGKCLAPMLATLVPVLRCDGEIDLTTRLHLQTSQ